MSEAPLPVMVCHGQISEDHSDYWEVKGRFWIRHHVRPRTTLFVPQEHSPGGPDDRMLSSIRETRFSLVGLPPGIGSAHIRTAQDNVRFGDWRVNTHYACVHEFTGITVFRLAGDYPDAMQDMQESQEREKAQGLRVPSEPTQSERAPHELTHLPYASW